MQARKDIRVAAGRRYVVRDLQSIRGRPFGPYPGEPGQGTGTCLIAQVDRMDALVEPELVRKRGVERSEEHTSELQSPCNLVCRLLLETKKHIQYTYYSSIRTL